MLEEEDKRGELSGWGRVKSEGAVVEEQIHMEEGEIMVSDADETDFGDGGKDGEFLDPRRASNGVSVESTVNDDADFEASAASVAVSDHRSRAKKEWYLSVVEPGGAINVIGEFNTQVDSNEGLEDVNDEHRVFDKRLSRNRVKKVNKLALKTAKDWRKRVQYVTDRVLELRAEEFVADVLDEKTVQMTPTDYCFVVKWVGHLGWQRAHEVYEWLNLRHWYAPNARTLATILAVLGKANQEALAVEIFSRAEQAIGNTVQVYNAMTGEQFDPGESQIALRDLRFRYHAAKCLEELKERDQYLLMLGDAKVDEHAVNPPEGFLSEWWSVFSSIYSARISTNREATGGVSSKALHSSERVRIFVRPSTIVPSRDVNHMARNICPIIQRPGFSNALQTTGEMTMLRPHAGNFLQNPSTTTMLRPKLNLDWSTPVHVSGPSVVDGLTATELVDTMRELERHEPPFDQFAHLLPSSINCSHLQGDVCWKRKFGSTSLSISNSENEDWTERFRSHTDSRPFGPQSISFDVSFYDADFVYGIPGHATSLALKPTRGPGIEGSEPYRLFNLDVFEYIHDSPLGLCGSIPFMISHGKVRNSSGKRMADRRAENKKENELGLVRMVFDPGGGFTAHHQAVSRVTSLRTSLVYGGGNVMIPEVKEKKRELE